MAQSNSSYISVIIHYGGFSGGAHGYENKVSFAYDLISKKEIKLSDLFSGDDDYLTKVSDISRLYLKGELEKRVEENFKDGEDEELKLEFISNYLAMIDNGTKPIEENFSVFSFTKEKINIYFGQYQVGPYSDGAQMIEIFR